MSVDRSNSGLDLHLDAAPRPREGRRAALERALRAAVRDGRLAPGARLPATRLLAADLGLSRGTVTAAYDQLAAEGYLAARRGSGTVVADLPDAPAPGPHAAGLPAVGRPRHDLRPGRPDPSSFPHDAWLRAARRVLPTAEPDAYGIGDPHGRPELRAALAEYAGRTRGIAARPENIVVVSGFQQALTLFADVLHRELGCRAVAMEDPCLPFHRDAVRRAGPAVLPLPVDADGATADVPDGAGAAVVAPAHQSPLGVALAPERRLALADWAAAGDRLLLEDDYDGEFRYDRQPIGALKGVAPDRVVYVGTASKTLSPGVRIAWAVLPPDLVAPFARAKALADGHGESLGQLVLAELVRSHAYDRHVRAMRAEYRRRRDLLLQRFADTALRPIGVAAGVHVTLRLPDRGPDEAEVLELARSRGIALEGLGFGWHDPAADHPRGLVVGYGAASRSGFSGAVDALRAVVREVYGR